MKSGDSQVQLHIKPMTYYIWATINIIFLVILSRVQYFPLLIVTLSDYIELHQKNQELTQDDRVSSYATPVRVIRDINFLVNGI